MNPLRDKNDANEGLFIPGGRVVTKTRPESWKVTLLVEENYAVGD